MPGRKVISYFRNELFWHGSEKIKQTESSTLLVRHEQKQKSPTKWCTSLLPHPRGSTAFIYYSSPQTKFLTAICEKKDTKILPSRAQRERTRRNDAGDGCSTDSSL